MSEQKVLVKLCGMRTEADVAGAVAAGCDLVGFIVEVPGKWRSISQERLIELTAQVPAEAKTVGVFVNAPVEAVHRLLAEGVIAAAQLHGSEDDAYIAHLRELLGEGPTAGAPDNPAEALNRPRPAPEAARIIKAFRIRGSDDVAKAAASTADLVLLDGGAGDGATFDWQLLAGFPRSFLLAGGLGPDNLAQAIAQARQAAGENLAGVDMSSGIETSKAKDPLKMKAAVQAAKGATR